MRPSASAAVAFECPHETTTPCSCRRSTRSSAPSSSGARVIWATGPALEQPLEERAIGIAPVGLRMGAEALRGEERPLEVRAEHPWPDRFGRQRAQGGDQVGLGCGDEGRLERGHPRRQERFAGLAVALGIRRGEVDAAEAVDVEVDEAGDGDPAPIPPRQCNLGQGAV